MAELPVRYSTVGATLPGDDDTRRATVESQIVLQQLWDAVQQGGSGGQPNLATPSDPAVVQILVGDVIRALKGSPTVNLSVVNNVITIDAAVNGNSLQTKLIQSTQPGTTDIFDGVSAIAGLSAGYGIAITRDNPRNIVTITSQSSSYTNNVFVTGTGAGVLAPSWLRYDANTNHVAFIAPNYVGNTPANSWVITNSSSTSVVNYANFSNYSSFSSVSNYANYANTSEYSNTANTAETAEFATNANYAWGAFSANSSYYSVYSQLADEAKKVDWGNVALKPNVVITMGGDFEGSGTWNSSNTDAVTINAVFNGNSPNGVNYAASAGTANYANYAGNVNYANFADTCRYSNSATNASYAVRAGQADFAVNASFAESTGYVALANRSLTADLANVALVATNANYADVSGQSITANNATSADSATNANYAYYANIANTANVAISAVDTNHANYADNALAANTAAYAITASNANTAGFAVTSLWSGVINKPSIAIQPAGVLYNPYPIIIDIGNPNTQYLQVNDVTHAVNADNASHALAANFATNANYAEYSNSASYANIANFVANAGGLAVAYANNAGNATVANVANAVAWGNIQTKPTTYYSLVGDVTGTANAVVGSNISLLTVVGQANHANYADNATISTNTNLSNYTKVLLPDATTNAINIGTGSIANGNYSIAIGYNAIANGIESHVFGVQSNAGPYSLALGRRNEVGTWGTDTAVGHSIIIANGVYDCSAIGRSLTISSAGPGTVLLGANGTLTTGSNRGLYFAAGVNDTTGQAIVWSVNQGANANSYNMTVTGNTSTVNMVVANMTTTNVVTVNTTRFSEQVANLVNLAGTFSVDWNISDTAFMDLSAANLPGVTNWTVQFSNAGGSTVKMLRVKHGSNATINMSLTFPNMYWRGVDGKTVRTYVLPCVNGANRFTLFSLYYSSVDYYGSDTPFWS